MQRYVNDTFKHGEYELCAARVHAFLELDVFVPKRVRKVIEADTFRCTLEYPAKISESPTGQERVVFKIGIEVQTVRSDEYAIWVEELQFRVANKSTDSSRMGKMSHDLW